ncbi:unnamed protein product [Linum trigynum]|uniref:Uncharacterized protein n=1 Tax=Linum trigynum TaxID=586398 RepID=A0AAV2FCJ4_9ROSI
MTNYEDGREAAGGNMQGDLRLLPSIPTEISAKATTSTPCMSTIKNEEGRGARRMQGKVGATKIDDDSEVASGSDYSLRSSGWISILACHTP